MGFMYLLKGVIIGFALAAPVGPLGVLCIRRTLAHGGKSGLIVGLSAAVADILYGFVAAFGITLISNFIYTEQYWIRLVGGFFLIVLGVHTLRTHVVSTTTLNGANNHVRAFFSTFFVALTNPITVMTFAAVFASVGLREISDNFLLALFLVVGVFLGTLGWFVLLTMLVRFFRKKIDTNGISIVNKIAGTVLIVFGLIALYSSYHGL